MMRTTCRRGGPPGWAAHGTGPRHGPGFGVTGQVRAQFFRRVAWAVAGVLMLSTAALFVTAWLVAGRFGLTGWAAVLPAVAALAVAATVVTIAFAAMRRFASSLGGVMDAADRVAAGDYGVRIDEAGPPPIRALTRSFNTMTRRLQHADRLRRDLMADVAHELRTPLTVLQGRLEGLLDGVYRRDDEQIGQLLEETQVLSRLIEDLRTLALSDAGALQLQTEPTEIVTLAQEVVRSMSGEAARRHIALDVQSSIAATVIELDPLRIREVLTNLLSNALRHTGGGGVVTVSLTPAGAAANAAIAVTVHDTGVGMSAEEVARMFDRFHKGETSRGSGLGLSIAKGIVTAHGGEISATSVPGKGTTVVFTVPRGLAT
jgi:signal transduction histidine kinase